MWPMPGHSIYKSFSTAPKSCRGSWRHLVGGGVILVVRLIGLDNQQGNALQFHMHRDNICNLEGAQDLICFCGYSDESVVCVVGILCTVPFC